MKIKKFEVELFKEELIYDFVVFKTFINGNELELNFIKVDGMINFKNLNIAYTNGRMKDCSSYNLPKKYIDLVNYFKSIAISLL